MLARVETEKRISLIKAWEESEKSKAENKYEVSSLCCLSLTFVYFLLKNIRKLHSMNLCIACKQKYAFQLLLVWILWLIIDKDIFFNIKIMLKLLKLYGSEI